MVITLGSVKIARPRLLAGSLAVAAALIAVMAIVAFSGGSDDGLDAVLTDPQDREIPVDSLPGGPSDLEGNGDNRGEQLASATLVDRDGFDVETDSLLGGQPLVINFWFSSCPPCERELPDFAEVHGEVGDEVRFIGVNTVDSVPVMERFAAERGVTYEMFQDSFGEFISSAGINNFPQTLFVTSSGEVVDQVGEIDAEELRDKIDLLQQREAT